MRVKGKHSIETIIFGIVEGLGLFPVFLMLAAFCLNKEEILLWFLGLLFLFFIHFLIRCLLNNHWRSLSFISAAVMVTIYSFLFFESIWAKMITLLIGFVVAFRGIQFAEKDGEQLVQSQFMWAISLPLYFVSYIIFAFNEHLAMYKNWISTAGFLFITIMVFMTNEQLLHHASFSKEKQKKVGSEVKRLNRIYLFIILLIIFFISNFQSIKSALYNAVKSFLGLLIGGEESNKPSKVGMNQPVRPPLNVGNTQTNPMPVWLDQLLWIIGIIFVVGFFVVVALLMIKKFRNMIRRLFSWMIHLFSRILKTGYRNDLVLEYEDEKVSLFDREKFQREVKENVQELFRKITKRKPNFEQMTMEEKIRFIYRFLAGEVKQQEKWRASLTAHEVLQLNERGEKLEQYQKWYDDIRYGKMLLNELEMKQVDDFWLRLQR